MAEAGDVAARAEGRAAEDFAVGARQNAMELNEHVGADQKLSLEEFSALVREREGEHTDEELLARFQSLDAGGSGQVDMGEYLRFSLKDALQRSANKVVELFKQWDADGAGEVQRSSLWASSRRSALSTTPTRRSSRSSAASTTTSRAV